MNPTHYKRLLPIIQKIKIFQGLTPDEVEHLVQVSQYRSFEGFEPVYVCGDESMDMLVLLRGKLKVIGQSGVLVGYIHPGTSTGEMGVFTGHTRSANVIAEIPSVGVVISKQALHKLFRKNLLLENKVLRNVVVLLSERLAGANHQLDTSTAKGSGVEQDIQFVHTEKGRLG